MSENRESEINQGVNPMAFLPGHGGKGAPGDKPIESQSDFLEETLQHHLVDPSAKLPLNSEVLNTAERLLSEAGLLVEEEVAMIQKHQKKIAFWEERIEGNRANIKKNDFQIRQNTAQALVSKKNRDYWFGRAEEVDADYVRAERASRLEEWAWLIKKYGLKNADGTPIDAEASCVEELCNGEAKNLAAAYRNAGANCEAERKEKEEGNASLVQENSRMLETNETLQAYIAATYSDQIEPLQDGILLLKELGLKLKAVSHSGKANYGEIRAWAESFLNEFIRNNPKVPQDVVTHFRRLTSIPLPPENC